MGASFHNLSLVENFDSSDLNLNLSPNTRPLPNNLGLLMENFGNVETPLYATRLPGNISLSSLGPSLNALHNHVFDFFFKLFAVSFSLNSSLPSEREDNTIKQNSLLRYHSQRNRMNWSGTLLL